jgi:hypothetical protein
VTGECCGLSAGFLSSSSLCGSTDRDIRTHLRAGCLSYRVRARYSEYADARQTRGEDKFVVCLQSTEERCRNRLMKRIRGSLSQPRRSVMQTRISLDAPYSTALVVRRFSVDCLIITDNTDSCYRMRTSCDSIKKSLKYGC